MLIEIAAAVETSLAEHADARPAFDRWHAIAAAAEWSSLTDVRKTFRDTDGVEVASGAIATVFNLKGNRYRLICVITYPALFVAALQLLTHAEYDREKWKRNL